MIIVTSKYLNALRYLYLNAKAELRDLVYTCCFLSHFIKACKTKVICREIISQSFFFMPHFDHQKSHFMEYQIGDVTTRVH